MTKRFLIRYDRWLFHFARWKDGWETYNGEIGTWRLALIDLLKNNSVKAIYFLAGQSIWMRMPL